MSPAGLMTDPDGPASRVLRVVGSAETVVAMAAKARTGLKCMAGLGFAGLGGAVRLKFLFEAESLEEEGEKQDAER